MSFFRSRWVERPGHVTELEPDGLPDGFCSGAVAAGLKAGGGLDVGVLFSDGPDTTSAARFTTNARVGAPVQVSRGAALDRLRAVVANSGGSNTGDGERGLHTARAAQVAAAEELGVAPEQVGVASTGVIGAELPRETLVTGVREACGRLGGDAEGLARAILTTDRGPKRACLEVELPNGRVRLAAQAKGAGMISPRFATMFCFVQTDAALDPDTVELLTRVCVKRSFDRISVDGQLSTSDTVFVMASGAGGVAVRGGTEEERLLGSAMDALMRQLAVEIVSDGEGSARVGRVVVHGDPEYVEPVARAVADSPLVKTALHGGDPNFGRVLQAAGQAMAGRDGAGDGELPVDLDVQGRRVVSQGTAVELAPADWSDLERAVLEPEVEYTVSLPGDGGATEVFFSDLSREYVTLNAEYTT